MIALPDNGGGVQGLTKSQFAKRWNWSEETVRCLMRQGLPFIQLSRRNIRIPINEGDEWVRLHGRQLRKGRAK